MLLLTFLIACATTPQMPGSTRPVGKSTYTRHHTTTTVGTTAAISANYYLTHPTLGFRNDCSGFVCASFDRAGLPLDGTVASLWDRAKKTRSTHKRKRPKIGDLVFFDDTFDKNKDGRVNDGLTHIGIVLSIDSRGTITIAHDGTSKGRSTLMMNLYHPSDHTMTDGSVANSYLRRKSSKDGRKAQYLAGELFRAFATLDHSNRRDWVNP